MYDNLKTYISEYQGICPNTINQIRAMGKGIIIQTDKEDKEEYLYFHTDYGLKEVYDIIYADNITVAVDKMVELNEEVENE